MILNFVLSNLFRRAISGYHLNSKLLVKLLASFPYFSPVKGFGVGFVVPVLLKILRKNFPEKPVLTLFGRVVFFLKRKTVFPLVLKLLFLKPVKFKTFKFKFFSGRVFPFLTGFTV